MSESVKKKLVIYLVFILVMITAGFALSMVFDPIPESGTMDATVTE